MNYPYPTASPYMQAAMSQAVQAFMSGVGLPPNCMFMQMPLPQLHQPAYPQATPYYNPSPYANHPPAPAPLPPQPSTQNYNYPVVPYTKPSKRKSSQRPHPNIYDSSSFDSYMDHLSWSRLFDRPSRRNTKASTEDQQPSKKSRSDSSSSSSSTTSDETIRRVNVNNQPSTTNGNLKQQTNGSLPFKYSSDFVPGLNKQLRQQNGQSQKIKSNDVFIIKKP